MSSTLDAFFHWSGIDLPPGTILESRFWKNAHMLNIVSDVLAMGPEWLRLLMLSDDLMFERFPKWKESGIARVDKVVQEVIFEQVRKDRFPHRPSRLGGIFLFPSMQLARRFGTQIREKDHFILSCTIDEGDPFVADMNLVKSVDPHRPIRDELDRTATNAVQYWSGRLEDKAWPEVIVNPGRVRVLQTAH